MPKNNQTKSRTKKENTKDIAESQTLSRPKKKSAEKPAASPSRKPRKRTKAKPHPSQSSIRWKLIAILVLLAALWLTFDIETINNNSMAPTLEQGDVALLLAPPLLPMTTEPGQILRIEDSNDDNNFWILRNIAQDSGDILAENKILKIDGVLVSQTPRRSPALVADPTVPLPHTETLPGGHQHTIIYAQRPLLSQTSSKATLEPGNLYLLGDNRMAAYDSRKFGPVSKKCVTGRVLFTIYSRNASGSLIGHWIKIVH